MSAGGGKKAVVAALAANLGIAASKFGAFLITGSSSMLAESAHSVADSGNQALLLHGHRRAEQAANREHPFGYGRYRYFYSFVVALVLFSLGSLFALYEGIEKLRHPHELSSPFVAVAVLIVAVGLEGFSFRTAIIESNAVRDGRGWWQFIRRSKAPELPVVLLEDAGALLGLLFALAGVGLTILTADPVWDGIGTLAISLLLGVIAIVLAFETKSLLIGEAADPAVLEKICEALESTPQVTRVIHLRTQHLGPEELLVAGKIEIDRSCTVPELAETIDAAERGVRDAVPIARVIYLEPDLYRAPSGADAPASV
ncbi:MAG TPA: cation diffusion facilitator family transporter [Mycobacteriales bacterium]|nr:cation diffusion facilitator family transporter [Mycobacteriales bacterium]